MTSISTLGGVAGTLPLPPVAGAAGLVRGGGPARVGPRPAGGDDAVVARNLQSLADTLGTDTNTLTDRINSGDVTRLVTSARSSWSQGNGAVTTGGVLVDTYAF